MSTKFLSFRPDPTRPLQLQDKKKWHSADGRTFKLLHADLETDKQFAYAEIKVSAKGMNQGERLGISGIANSNIVDRMQERLDPRGLDVTDYMKNSVLLAHHSYYHPIGQVESIDVQDDGVHFTGWIGDPSKAELTPMQKEIRSLVAQGILRTVSVGFIPKKVRAPVYDNQGNMTEPCVIEAWELLELSVVAVPANQDSVFEVRKFDSENNSAKMNKNMSNAESLNDSAIKDALSDAAQQNMVVQSLIFDKDIFTEEQAKKWATDHAFAVDKSEINDSGYCLHQRELSEFDAESLRTINLTEGVNAVVGKAQKDAGAETAKEDVGSDVQAQMMALLQQLDAGQKRTLEMCDLMLKKLEAKDGEEEVAEGEASASDTQKPEDEAAKALNARIARLEKGFDKLVSSVSMLIEKSQR